MELNALRAGIDEVDGEILRLFLQRMDLSEQIGAYKRAHALCVTDPAREREILCDVRQKAGAHGEYAQRLFALMIELSKARQQELCREEASDAGRV